MPYAFISFAEADLDAARLLKARLESREYTAWIDDRTDFIASRNAGKIVEDAIQFADVVIALNGGSPAELEFARRFGKTVLPFRAADDPADLLSKLHDFLSSPSVVPLPKPINSGDLDAIGDVTREGSLRIRLTFVLVLLLIVGGIVVLASLFATPDESLSALPTETHALEALDVTLPSPTLRITPTAVIPSRTSIAALPASATSAPILTSTQAPFATQVPLTSTTIRATVADSPTATPTSTLTATLTATPTHTLTYTPTVTNSPSATNSPTSTLTSTPVLTATSMPTTSALQATLLPSGSDNSSWKPIERQIKGLAMVYVPGGCFSAEGEQTEDTTDGALCVQPFWMGKTEITNGQYAACVAAGDCTAPASNNSRTHQNYYNDAEYADFPVINVTWTQALAYTQWIGGSLPSEIQWRYAVSGPANWPYPWGSKAPDPTLLNYDDTVGDATEVGAYPDGASWVGALDLAGNVWEWTVTPDGDNKVICGGSWNSYAGLINAAMHAANPDTETNVYTGFRVIMDAAAAAP